MGKIKVKEIIKSERMRADKNFPASICVCPIRERKRSSMVLSLFSSENIRIVIKGERISKRKFILPKVGMRMLPERLRLVRFLAMTM